MANVPMGLWACLTAGKQRLKDTAVNYKSADGARVQIPGIPVEMGSAPSQLAHVKALAESEDASKRVTGPKSKIGEDVQTPVATRTLSALATALEASYASRGLIQTKPARKPRKPRQTARKPRLTKAELRAKQPAPAPSSNGATV